VKGRETLVGTLALLAFLTGICVFVIVRFA
jgi:hypothetical protein